MKEEGLFFVTGPPEDPGPFYEKLDSAVHGLREFSLISAAVDLGIFDACLIPMTSEELASRILCEVHLCDLICKALVDEGFLTVNSGKYSDTSVVSTYLTRSSPYSQVHYIGQLARMGQDIWTSLAQSGPKRPAAV